MVDALEMLEKMQRIDFIIRILLNNNLSHEESALLTEWVSELMSSEINELRRIEKDGPEKKPQLSGSIIEQI